jgi:AcrR family transcriptional regulator
MFVKGMLIGLNRPTRGVSYPVMRSLPQQQRSKRRYAAVVDAGAELFATHGFDATTMEAIAAASGSAIGSVYRFFPNKQAVFRAVADRALDQVRALFIEIIGGVRESGELEWFTLLDRALDAFAEIHASEPALRAIIANLQLYGEFAEADERMTREFIAATTGALSAWAPQLDGTTRRIIATMIVQTTSAMLLMSHREAPDMAAAMLEHTKLMLRRYLEPWVGAPALGEH